MISIKYLSMYLSSTYQIIKYFNDICMRCINWSCVLIICSEFIRQNELWENISFLTYSRRFHCQVLSIFRAHKNGFLYIVTWVLSIKFNFIFFPKYINRDIPSRQWVKHLSKCNEKLDDTRPWLYGYHIHWFFLCLIFVSIYLSKTFHTTSHRNLTSVALPL